MIAVSSLISSAPLANSISTNASVVNQSALDEYERGINRQANMREYLVERFDSMLISSANTIKIQATSLAQLTQSTHQLTRATLVYMNRHCDCCHRFLVSRPKHRNDACNWHRHSCPSPIRSHLKMSD
jgi:hypothetical protein